MVAAGDGAGRQWATLIPLLVMSILLLGSGPVAGVADLNLSAERNVQGNVRLSWTYLKDPNVHHYEIFWDIEEIGSIEGAEPKATAKGNTYMPLDLEDGVRHHFVVTAVDGNGTVLVQDHIDAVPKKPHLKEVNFWNLMAVLLVTTGVFVLVILKVPAWVEEERGGG